MKQLRLAAIRRAASKTRFGVILGTLGRQGNPAIVQRIRRLLRQHGKQSFLVLLSEISPQKLALMPETEVWVQVACPRLSVDWGHCFSDGGEAAAPLLSPYELHVALEETEFVEEYPMDFYSNEGGPWANYHADTKARDCACGKEECSKQ